MQLSLNFGQAPPGAANLPHMRQRLLSAFGPFCSDTRLDPLDQLIKSLINARTHDEDTHATYDRLKFRYPCWIDLANAPAAEVRDLICPITHPGEKVDWLECTLKQIVRLKGALSLNFLADLSVEAALGWLKGLEGVRGKSAAAVLNFSQLRMRVMVVDSHVLRVAKRYGLVPDKSGPEAASQILMSLAPDAWTADDFYELHWLMKRLGQMRCTHGWARCGACPLAVSCEHRGLPERSNVARLHFRAK